MSIFDEPQWSMVKSLCSIQYNMGQEQWVVFNICSKNSQTVMIRWTNWSVSAHNINFYYTKLLIQNLQLKVLDSHLLITSLAIGEL